MFVCMEEWDFPAHKSLQMCTCMSYTHIYIYTHTHMHACRISACM